MARQFANVANRYYSVGDVVAIDITGTTMTVSAWVFPSNFTNSYFVLSKSASGTVQYSLEQSTSGQLSHCSFRIGDGAGSNNVADGPNFGVTSQWQHYAGRKNGTGASALTAWKNGVSGTAASSPLTIGNTAQPLILGAETTGASGYAGNLAEIAIWDVALTDAEIVNLASGVVPFAIRSANLKGYWPLCGVADIEPDISGNNNFATPAAVLAPVAHVFTNPYCSRTRTANLPSQNVGRVRW